MAKMSQDQLDLLVSFAGSDAEKALLLRLEMLLESMEKELISYDINARSDRELILLKAQSQGARKLFKTFEADLQKLRKQS